MPRRRIPIDLPPSRLDRRRPRGNGTGAQRRRPRGRPGQVEMIAERRAAALELRKAGGSYREIARQLGVDVHTIHGDVAAELAALRETTVGRAEELRALELERYDLMVAGLATGIQEGNPTAVMAGVRVSERRARLLGLDEPVRIRLFQAVRLRHQPRGGRDQEERSEIVLDTSMLAFLAAPFVASLILTGIHAYLGVHVVERGVIFVDLSLAQIAAFGATIALLMPISGNDPHAPVVYWISLAFTFLGAFVFSTIRSKRARIPQEAIIGICYAVASAAAILAMSKATSESEHLKDMLVGNILAVSWPEVGKTALLYTAIGTFHYIFRKKFLAISMDHKLAEDQGVNVKFWDFMFYASFGFVVTSSVAIAGVLLVFCYLIVPSVAAMLYADSIGKRLAIGWSMGTLVSALGVYLSLKLDLPTGATIVCTFGLALIVMAAIRPLIQSNGSVQPR